MHIRSEILEGLDNELVRTQRPGSGPVVQALRSAYADAQGSCVRRLVDTRKGMLSLPRLVAEMAAHSTVLTRQRYVSRYDEKGISELGERDFDDLAGEGADHMPRQRLLTLRADIEAAGRTVKQYVDEHIAHRRIHSATALTWGEVKQAVHDLSEFYTQVGQILTTLHHVPAPVMQFAWQQPFMTPLFVDCD